MPSHDDLLGRDPERVQIQTALDAAIAGAGRVLALEGPPGIGKTRLLSEARALADAAGMTVLRAACGELERHRPFGVATQLVRTDDAGWDDPETAVAALLDRVRAFVMQGPALICVDDVHWADALSLRWLVAVAREVPNLALTVIVTRRAPETESPPLALDELTRSVLAHRLVLEPLDAAAISRLTREAIVDADEHLCSVCHAVTNGNPFLLLELLKAMRSVDLDPTAEAVARVEAVELGTVAAWLLVRMNRMPREAFAFAQAAAVLRRHAPPRHAQRVSGLTPAEADAARDVLVAGGVLTSGDSLEFVHPVLRSAVYGDLAPSVRARLHREAATVLHDEQAAADSVAAHLLEIPGRADPWVVERLREAAAHARRHGAPEAAAAFLRRALDEPPSADLLAAVLGELAAALWRAADPEGALAALERALALPLELADQRALTMRLVRYLLWENRHLEALRTLDRFAPQPDGEEEAATTAAEAVAIAAAGAPRVLPRRVRVLTELSGAQPPPAARAVLAYLDAGAGRPVTKVAPAAETVIAEALETPDVSRTPLWPYGVVALALTERFELLDRFLGRCAAEAEDRGSVPDLVAAACWQAFCDYRRGRLRSAESLCERALAAARRARSGAFVPATIGVAVETAMALGRDAEVVDALLAEVPEAPQDSFVLSYPLYARGRWRIATGHHEAGLRDLERTGEVTAINMMDNPAWAPWRSQSVPALLRLGREDQALKGCHEELRMARDFGAPRAIGMALRGMALVQQGAERIELLTEAASHFAAAEAMHDQGVALLHLGRALRQDRRRRDARMPLALALDLGERCHAAPLIAEASAELDAAGAKPRPRHASGLASLTASELRVARLAAEGHSNRDIAAALFVTVKTVEKHLAATYRKLDVVSRRELGGALLAEGSAHGPGRPRTTLE